MTVFSLLPPGLLDPSLNTTLFHFCWNMIRTTTTMLDLVNVSVYHRLGALEPRSPPLLRRASSS